MSPTLLVLDDDPNVLTLLGNYFGGLGWRVEACAEAEAALRLADSDTPFDAVRPSATAPTRSSPSRCLSRGCAMPRFVR